MGLFGRADTNAATAASAGTAGSDSESVSSASAANDIYAFTVQDSKNQPYPLSQFRGQVVLMVNVASKCGFTPQYAGLEELYQKIRARYPDTAFTILGFPCNQFGGQEPGTNEDIQQFCTNKWQVTFPVLGKVDVNGDAAAPVWQWMKHHRPGLMGLKRVKWNFEKFLIAADGRVVDRWASTTPPAALAERVEEELQKAGFKPKEKDLEKADL